MRTRGRVDASHGPLRDFFRAHGVRFLDLAAIGHGCPDALVGFGERLALVEIKDGAKSPSRRVLTTDQIMFHQQWPVRVVKDEIDALAVIRELKR